MLLRKMVEFASFDYILLPMLIYISLPFTGRSCRTARGSEQFPTEKALQTMNFGFDHTLLEQTRAFLVDIPLQTIARVPCVIVFELPGFPTPLIFATGKYNHATEEGISVGWSPLILERAVASKSL
jgi:hypothetical protein